MEMVVRPGIGGESPDSQEMQVRRRKIYGNGPRLRQTGRHPNSIFSIGVVRVKACSPTADPPTSIYKLKRACINSITETRYVRVSCGAFVRIDTHRLPRRVVVAIDTI